MEIKGLKYRGLEVADTLASAMGIESTETMRPSRRQ